MLRLEGSVGMERAAPRGARAGCPQWISWGGVFASSPAVTPTPHPRSHGVLGDATPHFHASLT